MTLRRRLTILAATSVALAICLASVVVYLAVRGELRGQTDDVLRAQAEGAHDLDERLGQTSGPGSVLDPILSPPDGPSPFGAEGPIFIQRIGPSGDPAAPIGPAEFNTRIPIVGDEASIATSGEGEQLADAEINGEHFRVITVGIGASGALQIARSLEGTDEVLSNLRIVLVLVILGGIGLSALLARRVADRIIAPITGLTEAAEHISETEDLSRRIEAGGEDEVGRLAARFNSMLATLEGSRAELADSVRSQRELVADASHELRTPVASLRTDIEVLRENLDLPEDERRRMLAGVDARIAELGALITDVIELARGDEIEGALSDVRLDLLVSEAVERMRGLAPARRFELTLSATVVEARADRLGRAVNNLLDNAVKFSPAEEPIEVTVGDGELVVRDHGAGIPDDELARVFDRFHRGSGVRDVPGSGLGLAIVKQVAEAHGGSVAAANAPGGGAVFTLRLPAG
jgi:two-component system sensor histidine kinase MprB